MAWTYGADPTNSDRDAVRLLIGDTDTNDQQLQDSEIEYFLSAYGSTGSGRVAPAAVDACDALVAKYARQADVTNQGLSVKAGQRYEHYLALAKQLRDQAYTLSEVFLGGETFSGAETLDENSNLIPPSFRIGQDDYPPRRPTDPEWLRN